MQYVILYWTWYQQKNPITNIMQHILQYISKCLPLQWLKLYKLKFETLPKTLAALTPTQHIPSKLHDPPARDLWTMHDRQGLSLLSRRCGLQLEHADLLELLEDHVVTNPRLL